uniref:Uncharacterized protein n=1 Tax=Davidia involucrata TaxID=16924 RepID=A0A5B7BGD8_DAVIN
MNYQSTSRNQRPKGFNVKQGFQFALLLAVCIWLWYQTKHSHDKRKDSIQSKLGEEDGSLTLGRKGNAGLVEDRNIKDNVSSQSHGHGENISIKDMYSKGPESAKGSMPDTSTLIQDKYQQVKETVPSQSHDMEDGVYSFHDENGVPLIDIIEPMPVMIRENILRQRVQMIIENMPIEEVESKE